MESIRIKSAPKKVWSINPLAGAPNIYTISFDDGSSVRMSKANAAEMRVGAKVVVIVDQEGN